MSEMDEGFEENSQAKSATAEGPQSELYNRKGSERGRALDDDSSFKVSDQINVKCTEHSVKNDDDTDDNAPRCVTTAAENNLQNGLEVGNENLSDSLEDVAKCDNDRTDSTCNLNHDSKDETSDTVAPVESATTEEFSASADAPKEEKVQSQAPNDVSKEEKLPPKTAFPENLPECKTKRSYVCGFCNMKTNNPREYLYHLRDTHRENIKIYECSLCIYASKTHQKLARHTDMVHKIKVKPDTEPRKKSKGKSSKPVTGGMSRSPRESKSPRRFEEYEFPDDNDADLDEYYIPSKITPSGKQVYQCDQCNFYSYSPKVLGRHETKFHLKRKFYKCSKCNYATHMKARYTKHLKYHQLPIIKCEWCDFRTPYRWNLDRHNKNHTDEFGEHRCHMCNFTAQIKQSLTVHVANHHLTPEQVKAREAKRTMGISNPEDCIADDELELLRMEREEDLEALEVPSPQMTPNQSFTVSNIDMGSLDDCDSPTNEAEFLENGEPQKKKPKIKITLKKMKSSVKDKLLQELNERHNFDDDFIHPDDVVHRNGNVYIKTEKCSLCSFKAPFQCEVQRHKKKVHGIHALKETAGTRKVKKQRSFEKIDAFPSVAKLLNSESISSAKLPDADSYQEENLTLVDSEETAENNYFSEVNDVMNEEEESDQKTSEDFYKDSLLRKKSSSFFDKLQEKLSLSNVQNLVCQFCGHESKCLSESVRHQKLHLSAKNIFASASLSTRCQFCRHRCKTTDDLMNHLKSCPEARKNQINDNMIDSNALDTDGNSEKSPRGKTSEISDDSESLDNKHPMENKVFVWNNISNFEDDEGIPTENEISQDERSRSPSDIFSDNFENSDQIIDSKLGCTVVYRCPQCSFRSTTASRFHVHMVGHYNKKPYCCSVCSYRSNWRWDITKHIKLKIPRDVSHKDAEIRLADEALIEKHYEKYDQYLTPATREEIHHSEGGFSMSRKGRQKIHTETDSTGTDSAKSSPCPTPVPTASSASKIPALPKLTRAPNRHSSSGPNPFGPVLPGAQTMEENGNTSPFEDDLSKKKFNLKPPPLVAMGALAQQLRPSSQPSGSEPSASSGQQNDRNKDDTVVDSMNASSSDNYQIITPQGAMNTSLETLQLLASGSTNLARLKRQQKETGEGKDPELDAAVANQMRLLLWLNCLVGGTEEKEGEASGNAANESDNGATSAASIMKLVLDHEGNPEWKCSSCDFRDNERETVVQHVRLAHGKKGPVSLVHAVHRCSICGFAAGTKRHVQVHLESAHSGQGGIISRSEGQNIDPENGCEETLRSFECRLCPFTSKKRGELKCHLSHHTPRVDYIFKCMFCPFYVATKNELFSHLSVHGMDLPSSTKDSGSNGYESISTTINSQNSDEAGTRQFICDLCPFETRSRAKLMHHRQFHRPRGLPFSCPHCSYNVTRRHLLAQHLRIHGVSPTEGMDIETAGDKPTLPKLYLEDAAVSRNKSPSPSLTITPISGASSATTTANGVTTTSAATSSDIDPACLPILSNELTKNLHDIPLVWVSREGRFFKMFKCRHCPHVNLRKTNIQEHEKMHRGDGLVPGTGHACQFCSYVCINAGVMSAHVKVHSGSMGLCHALVDQALPNDEQLRMLAGSFKKKAVAHKEQGDEKLLHYCQQCPARFFFGREVHIHSRFHSSSSNLTHHCSKCNFGAREESQVLAHVKVHTPEYQERTRTLMSMHPAAPSYPPVSGLSVPGDIVKSVPSAPLLETNSMAHTTDFQVNGLSRPWLTKSPSLSTQTSSNSIPQPPPTNRFKCDQCPSTFSKLITLQYHQSLHSADNPFRCNRCTYAAKTQDGLQQHTALHEQADIEKSTARTSATPSPTPSLSLLSSPQKILENTLGALAGGKLNKGLVQSSLDQPPIKLKFIGLKGSNSSSKSTKKQQFKYYIEEQVPLSGVELLKRKHQIEREMPKDAILHKKSESSTNKARSGRQEDRVGNPMLHYPLHIDKSSGRSREKRYKCLKCPSAFEKLDQFNVHLNLHGSNFKYKCRICDYSVKFYANFMMHIKRHKYHEKMDAQRRGIDPPADDDTMFEPFIGDKSTLSEIEACNGDFEESVQDKENQFDFNTCPEMTMAEKQHALLQHKKSDAFLPKDEDKDRRIFYCQYCPYANPRRDAVDSHSLRHQANGGRGLHQCNFCDYTASGPNFIREHTKVHFRPFKYVIPEGFMRHDKLELWSIKSGDSCENDDTPKKCLIFAHEEGIVTPKFEENESNNKYREDTPDTNASIPANDSGAESGILVDFRSGDIVEAPHSFIIPLRPSKGKGSLISSSNGASFSSKNLKSSSSSKHKKGARKHTKLKPSPCETEVKNSPASEPETKVEFHEATVNVEETNGFELQPSDAEINGEDPLDISNQSENITEDSNDGMIVC